MAESEPDFRSTASIETLKQRAKLLAAVRRFFDQRGFFEVETPILSNDIVVDRYLQPIPVKYSDVITGGDDQRRLWLQTSPEFAMKRLLASGAKAIYQITKAFRAGEAGDQHNPEFTMLEWYRVGDDYHAGMDLLAELTLSLFSSSKFDFERVEKRTYAEVFKSFAGVDPLSCDLAKLKACAAKHGVSLESDSEDIDFWRNLILTHVVQPKLGTKQPTIVFDWPESQSALAQIRVNETTGISVAERFELYVGGVELANGYHELLDADELQKRNAHVNTQRESDGVAALPVESRLLKAMDHGLPACSGVAMGIDRLAMVLLRKSSIRDVIAFPIDRA